MFTQNNNLHFQKRKCEFVKKQSGTTPIMFEETKTDIHETETHINPVKMRKKVKPKNNNNTNYVYYAENQNDYQI